MKRIDAGFGQFGEAVSAAEERNADRFFEDLVGESLYGRAHETGSGSAASTAVRLPPGFRLGIWVDVGGRALGRDPDTHALALNSIGVNDASVYINGARHRTFGFNTVTQSVLRTFANRLESAAVKLTITSWIRPNKAYIDALLAALPREAIDLRARAIEFNAEEPWTRASPSGFSTHEAAAQYLFDGLASARQAGLEIVVNCQTDATSTSRMVPLTRRADVVIPQTYTQYNSRPSHQVGGIYGPQGIQERGLQKVAQAKGMSNPTMIMGLAAWNRHKWSGYTSRRIMELELEKTIALRSRAQVLGARYWSWKHIRGFDGRGGRPAKSYPWPFLGSLVRT